jgi:type I restriction enzyme M protein
VPTVPSVRQVGALAGELNRRLHLAKVDADQRAVLVAVTLLALAEDPGLDPAGAGGPAAAVGLVNKAASGAFAAAGRLDLWPAAELRPPAGQLPGYGRALADLVELLRGGEALSAVRADDVLGACFEAFLRYGAGRDLGIVLTPRHLCRLGAEALDVGPGDTVYDPAAGTGGFLVAAYNRVRAVAGPAGAAAFAQAGLHGTEASARVAVLAVANLHLRGGGAGHLRVGSALAGAGPERPVTKVLMNPPFGLKGRDELEPAFVDHGLAQLADGGLLFAVLPASVMYDAGFASWRTGLLAANRLLAVVAFPPDVFYPVATETVGVVLRAGQANGDAPVLWARVSDDGFVKRKGVRVERSGPQGAQGALASPLAPLGEALRDWVGAGLAPAGRPGELELHPVDQGAGVELLPQAHLGMAELDRAAFEAEVRSLHKQLTTQLWDQAQHEGRGNGG